MGITEPILRSHSIAFNQPQNKMRLALNTAVVPGRLELPTSTLSVWRSNHLSYRTGRRTPPNSVSSAPTPSRMERYTKPYTSMQKQKEHPVIRIHQILNITTPQKGGVPAAPSGTATLLRLRPNHQPHLRPLPVGPRASGVADFHDVTGGVYKARERIHRSVADLRLLATPTSRCRVADTDPN